MLKRREQSALVAAASPAAATDSKSIVYGSRVIDYRVTRMERKRAYLAVMPDLHVHVKAPLQASDHSIQSAVRQKARWILRQQRFFTDLLPRTPRRRLVSGESHLYLGRKYRLKIDATGDGDHIALRGGYFHLTTRQHATPVRRAALLSAWYRLQAARVFRERLDRCAEHPALRRVGKVRLIIRRMKRRWGSCTARGNLVINVDLIRAPRGCIDYVITHELCHLLVPDHSRRFTNLLDRVMPDWRDRKSQLERLLA